MPITTIPETQIPPVDGREFSPQTTERFLQVRGFPLTGAALGVDGPGEVSSARQVAMPDRAPPIVSQCAVSTSQEQAQHAAF